MTGHLEKRLLTAARATAICATATWAMGTAGMATLMAGAFTSNLQAILWSTGMLALAAGAGTAALAATLAAELLPDSGQETETRRPENQPQEISAGDNACYLEPEVQGDDCCSYSGSRLFLQMHDPAIAAAPHAATTVTIRTSKEKQDAGPRQAGPRQEE